MLKELVYLSISGENDSQFLRTIPTSVLTG
jgi:hypothetical protein